MEGTYRVEITATAEADVAGIWDYIAQDSPAAASAFILRLDEQIGALERFPKRCPYVPESRLLGERYRQLLFGSLSGYFQNCR